MADACVAVHDALSKKMNRCRAIGMNARTRSTMVQISQTCPWVWDVQNSWKAHILRRAGKAPTSNSARDHFRPRGTYAGPVEAGLAKQGAAQGKPPHPAQLLVRPVRRARDHTGTASRRRRHAQCDISANHQGRARTSNKRDHSETIRPPRVPWGVVYRIEECPQLGREPPPRTYVATDGGYPRRSATEDPQSLMIANTRGLR